MSDKLGIKTITHIVLDYNQIVPGDIYKIKLSATAKRNLWSTQDESGDDIISISKFPDIVFAMCMRIDAADNKEGDEVAFLFPIINKENNARNNPARLLIGAADIESGYIQILKHYENGNADEDLV